MTKPNNNKQPNNDLPNSPERGTITIQGTEYALRVTMGTLLRFARLTGHDADNLSGSLEDTLTFVWCALQSGSKTLPWDSLESFADSLTPADLTSLHWL